MIRTGRNVLKTNSRHERTCRFMTPQSNHKSMLENCPSYSTPGTLQLLLTSVCFAPQSSRTAEYPFCTACMCHLKSFLTTCCSERLVEVLLYFLYVASCPAASHSIPRYTAKHAVHVPYKAAQKGSNHLCRDGWKRSEHRSTER